MDTAKKVGIGIIIVAVIAIICLSLNLHKMIRFAERAYVMECQQGGEPEWGERDMVFKYLDPSACVLEFGGGAGSVSSLIQKILNTPTNHVVVEPGGDGEMFGGLKQLRKNKKACNSTFHIVDHVLEKGEDVRSKVSKSFDTIVADCEGCLYEEYKKNPELFSSVKTIIVERDDSGAYDELFKILNMKKLTTGVHSHLFGMVTNEVWTKI